MNNNKNQLKNKKNKNKNNENKNENYKQEQTNEIKSNKEYKFKNIKTDNGYECIGPCYPANTIYYNPLTLTPIKSAFPTCPINNKETKKHIFADKCNILDVNDEYLYFDIFDDSVQIANSSDNFLKQIYNINNIADVVYYLNNSIDEIPIFSQKRILKAIFEVYYKYVEFPKLFFSDRILKILNEIYLIDDKISNKQVMSDLDKINSESLEIYNYFLNKYIE